MIVAYPRFPFGCYSNPFFKRYYLVIAGAILVLLAIVVSIVGFVSLAFIERGSVLSTYVTIIAIGAAVVSLFGILWSLYLINHIRRIKSHDDKAEIERLSARAEEIVRMYKVR